MANKSTPFYFSGALFLFILLTAGTTKVQAQALPRPDHIVILIEENEPNAWVVGDGPQALLGDPETYAPTINALAEDSMSAVFTGMYALTHPSQPNYLYLFSGDEQGVTTDNTPVDYPFTTPNLAYQLLSKGLSFATYSEDLPYAGAQDTTSEQGSYARKHNPVANWQGTGTNQVPDSLSQPYTNLPMDYSQLPTVSYVVPDEDSDMHNGLGLPPIESGDSWFCEHLECHSQSSFMDWVRTHNTLFILTFDEDNGAYQNNIPTIFFGPMVQSGTYSQNVSLLSILGMIEDMYGLGYATSATSTATPITFCWKPTATAINDVNGNNTGLSIYPNPASSYLTIDGTKWTGPTSEVSITDVTGRVIAKYVLPESRKLDINVSTFAPGMYFYYLDQSNSMVASGKFTVAR